MLDRFGAVRYRTVVERPPCALPSLACRGFMPSKLNPIHLEWIDNIEAEIIHVRIRDDDEAWKDPGVEVVLHDITLRTKPLFIRIFLSFFDR
jgi:hypothetical protein